MFAHIELTVPDCCFSVGLKTGGGAAPNAKAPNAPGLRTLPNDKVPEAGPEGAAPKPPAGAAVLKLP